MWNTLCFCILLLHVATRIFFCTFRVINNHTDLVGIFSAFIHDEFILSECVKKHLFTIVIHAERNVDIISHLCIDNILIFSFHSLEFKRQAKGTLLLLLLICLLQFLKHWKSSHSVTLLLPSCLQVFLLLFVFPSPFPPFLHLLSDVSCILPVCLHFDLQNSTPKNARRTIGRIVCFHCCLVDLQFSASVVFCFAKLTVHTAVNLCTHSCICAIVWLGDISHSLACSTPLNICPGYVVSRYCCFSFFSVLLGILVFHFVVHAAVEFSHISFH